MTLDEKTYRRLRGANCADEVAFLQGCLKRYFVTTGDLATTEFATPDIALRIVFEIATLNKIANFVLKVLPPVQMGEGSVEFMRSLDAYHRNTILLNSSSLVESLAVQKALRRAHIDFAFLKGPVQQSLLYGDYFMKLSGDVNVLVSPAKFVEAREALRSIGYEVTNKSHSVQAVRFLGEQHMTKVMPTSSTVHLYHRLPQPGSPNPRNLDGFLTWKRSVEVVGGQVPFISGTNVLLLSCVSVADAIFNREPCAGYVCDVRASVSGMREADQWGLIDFAEEQGLVGTLLLGMRAADLLLGEVGGPLSESARGTVIGIDDQDLRNMVIAPWLSSKRWPQKRAALRELFARIPVREMAASELSRASARRPASVQDQGGGIARRRRAAHRH